MVQCPFQSAATGEVFCCRASAGKVLTHRTPTDGAGVTFRSKLDCRSGASVALITSELEKPGKLITISGKRAAGTSRCSTTPMNISNTRGTADALPAFEKVICYPKDSGSQPVCELS
ncbi:hypothetical protein RR46_05294 [Papilio xuthus]|uniref:Uncharacterized protein n=1 Tax=Papilio xuthus TaxID=66420 RepID=A0A194Q6M7_PAPXU|nr:hypothetical protein RR46_05294 [Papilio xuthus]